jgi:hypothetical protein
MSEIADNRALFDLVAEVAESLEAGGVSASATELRHAVSISTVPTEVLGEVRIVLRRLHEHPEALEATGAPELGSALGYLDRILGPQR